MISRHFYVSVVTDCGAGGSFELFRQLTELDLVVCIKA